MDDHLRAHRDATLALVERLIRQGRALDSPAAIRIWQQDCAVAINELSGGSKAHWLSRAFSAALLVRPSNGGVVLEASPTEIVERLLDVLAQAKASLAHMDHDAAATSAAAPAPHRFDFVHNAELRPVLEQAYRDSGHALERGDCHLALITACSILEAIITDALEHAVRLKPDTTGQGVVQRYATEAVRELPFDARIAAAERAALIRGGCSRLPALARTYRGLPADASISERDAKLARQVLHVVMRDLDPGR